jgi:hypothetical protein
MADYRTSHDAAGFFCCLDFILQRCWPFALRLYQAKDSVKVSMP